MKENKFSIVIQFMIGVFIMPEYYNHIQSITKTKKNNDYYYNNHYRSAHINKYKSNIKIRNFNRNSKVNLI